MSCCSRRGATIALVRRRAAGSPAFDASRSGRGWRSPRSATSCSARQSSGAPPLHVPVGSSATATTYGRSFGLRGLPPALHSIAETFLRIHVAGAASSGGCRRRPGDRAVRRRAMLLRRAAPRDRWLPIASAGAAPVGWALIVWWWPLMAASGGCRPLPILILWWNSPSRHPEAARNVAAGAFFGPPRERRAAGGRRLRARLQLRGRARHRAAA